MVKQLGRLCAIFVFIFAQAASAQTFPKPPDVPAYVPVTPTYAAGTTENVYGDGVNPGGGPAPADSYELADIPRDLTGLTTAAGASPETTLTGGAATESKFRTLFGSKIALRKDDPIRNNGEPGTSHCHVFFGNTSVNAYSTFESLRNTPVQFAQATGKLANLSGYWFPCVMKINPFGDGKDYVVRPGREGPTRPFTIYYQDNPSNSYWAHDLAFGLRYVGGYDMDSGGVDQSQSDYMQGLVDTANAQPGTAGRYEICDNGTNCQVYARWTCGQETDGLGQATSKMLKNADGSDPWGGHCKAGDSFWIQFSGPRCWDGTNLWAPGGYKNVIPQIWDNTYSKFVCPNGWFLIPALQFQVHFPQNGFADYGSWVLSSDIMAGKTSTPGITFHSDWFGAWDGAVMRGTDVNPGWLRYCIGTHNNTPHECDDSAFKSDTKLNTFGDVFVTDTATAADMVEMAPQQNGPATIHVHGN